MRERRAPGNASITSDPGHGFGVIATLPGRQFWFPRYPGRSVVIRVFIADDKLVRQGIAPCSRPIPDHRCRRGGERRQSLLPFRDAIDVRCRRPDAGQERPDVIRERSRRATLPPTLVLTTFDDDTIVLDSIRRRPRPLRTPHTNSSPAPSGLASGATAFQPAMTERLGRPAAPSALASEPDRARASRGINAQRWPAGSKPRDPPTRRTAEGDWHPMQ